MQWSLVAAFIPIVNILWCGASALDCNYTSFLLGLGYSKECIDSSQSSLISCSNGEATSYKECCPAQENITTTLTEVKMEQEKQRKNSEALWEKLEKISNSLSDIKTILQESNVTDNSQSRDLPIPGGTTSTPEEIEHGKELPKNCADLKVLGDELSGGVQTVYPYFPNPRPVVVYCDQVTDGGGWTVIQSRSPLPVRENFQRNWDEYVEGFGDLTGEFWLGLDNIHALTNSAQMQLRIDLEDAEGQRRWAHYATFHVGDAASEYVLSIGGYSGDAGDGMTYPSFKDWNSNGMMFSTFDHDNDLYSSLNCAKDFKGGWWYNRCDAAHLNGLPIVGEAPGGEGLHWFPFRGWTQSMKKATMRIRPVSLGF